MKFLLVTLVVLTTTAHSACEITLARKTDKSKSAFVGNTSVTASVQEALKTQCKLKYVQLTKERQIEIATEAFNKKISKLKK